MGTVIAEITVVPIDTQDTSIHNYVKDAVDAVKAEHDIKYQVNAMGTVLEGELSAIMKIIGQMHEAPFNDGASRVLTDVRIDDRRDKTGSMERKVAEALGQN